MAKVHGKNGIVRVGENTVLHTSRWTLDRQAAIADASAQGEDWEDHTVGLKRWNGTIDCWYDQADSTGQGALEPGATVGLELYPAGNGSSAIYYSGTASIEGAPLEVSREGTVSVSFTFRGKGPLARQAVGD